MERPLRLKWEVTPETVGRLAETKQCWSFERMFMGTVVGRMDDKEAIFKRILDDEEFRDVLMDLYAAVWPPLAVEFEPEIKTYAESGASK